jgi:lipase chaperone LimK
MCPPSVVFLLQLEDCGLKGLQEYVMSYRAYSEQFSALIRELMSDELDVDRVHKAMDQLEHLKEKTSKINFKCKG